MRTSNEGGTQLSRIVAFAIIGLLAGSSASGAASPAGADDPKATGAKATEEAKTLYAEGRAQYALGHFQEALGDFEKAYLARQLPSLLFNIAQCHRMLKNFEEAAVTFRSFIRDSPDSPQLRNAQELLAEVEQALHAQQAAKTKPPLDDNGRDTPPVVTPPAPQHVLDENLPLPKKAVATGSAGTVPPVATNTPTTAPGQAVVAEVQPAEPAPRRRLFAWIAGGAGVAAVATGAVFGLMSKSTSNNLGSSQHSRDQVSSLESQLSSQAATANVLFAAGGGLLALGGALFVLRF